MSSPATRSRSVVTTSRAAKSQTSLNFSAPSTGIKASPSGNAKAKGNGNGNGNGSILAFFKKVNGPVDGDQMDDGESLFMGSSGPVKPRRARITSPAPVDDLGLTGSRFNEDERSNKRRRTGLMDTETGGSGFEGLDGEGVAGGLPSPPVSKGDSEHVLPMSDSKSTPPPVATDQTRREDNEGQLKGCRRGPFVEESDSESEVVTTVKVPLDEIRDHDLNGKSSAEDIKIVKRESPEDRIPHELLVQTPTLKQEATEANSMSGLPHNTEEFFGEDEYADGEEFLERKWMEEEQGRLELGEDDEVLDDEDSARVAKEECIGADLLMEGAATDLDAASCPICNASLGGISDGDAQLHVNHCLDGNPIPLPERRLKPKTASIIEVKATAGSTRFQRPVRPAKPGQADPFACADGRSTPGTSSAFSKLMSSKAEDMAWATAAAAENRARGRPAYERTCPFYKILPGFKICVDAFRYGAVEGCQAYFLSHFHSDHYVGLTSTWCHGPIYCSHVTANLVRQQLRVDPKYVVDLEFEAKFEVPGTNGVEVTNIPANHCPGSSIFLFEKKIGTGKAPKVHRVLHCGDFRACPEHLNHPLLRPDHLDPLTGQQLGQQKIDVCYLDTTYLNPRYAFPPQEDVIRACSDMCVSLSKERTDDDDAFETMKRDRAGSGMTRFVRTESDKPIKPEADSDPLHKPDPKDTKPRGRLLVVVGTYSIGKERICLGIARALGSKIFAPPGKRRICACLEDAELNSLLTSDPAAAQVHMTPLFEIRAETLQDYLNTYRPHFSRVVGFRPSGWNYKPPHSRFVESPAVQTVLHSDNWKSNYSMAELVPQRGSTRQANCFGVPYSEHSSFRELTMFCCALRIDKVIPTVNVGSAKGRERMKGWFEKWAVEKKKNGLFQIGKPDEAGKGVW